ncbi:MAG: tRNA lysidine(34) synthetase TilS [Verrucomicrobia bacterium]|nr:tRNA lysidine(34) synthetase TilS [Verrucomicrobiota bacterium]MDE3098469.1 tRNA lysidine(34) synthetase TilS [Verrucomicrobiota bacterium]
MADLLQRIEQNIRNRRLLKPGQKLLAAVSGGLDSMALLHALAALSRNHSWKIVVAHLNHRLRGRAADADEQLVRKTARALDLPFVARRANVKKFARQSRLSIETAARQLRHEFLARTAQERKIATIALAHHADDQVELFFLRLLRGAGGRGLAGMNWRSPSPADPSIPVVRPLLDLPKSELEQFADENKIRFRHDATNFSDEHLRNRVRNELLPLLKKNYQPATARTVLRAMEVVGAESEFAGEAARRWLRARRAASPAHEPFEKLPPAIQRRVLEIELAAAGVGPDFDLIESLRGAAGVFTSISRQFSVARTADGRVLLREEEESLFDDSALRAAVDAAGQAAFGGVRFKWRISAPPKHPPSRGKRGCELFDREKIGRSIVLRHWRAGDRFRPIGMRSAVKLQDLLTNAKIPRPQRRRLAVAAAENGVLFWVEGLRIAEEFKVTPRTKRCLAWSWRRAEQ